MMRLKRLNQTDLLEVAEEAVGAAAAPGLAAQMVGHNAGAPLRPRLSRPGGGNCKRAGRPGGAGKPGRRAAAG